MSKVYLIGAGPGDEELITLKGIRALQKCTAVMYDRLASSSLLKYLSKDCRTYYCGKEPGCHYKTQEQINDMLVELAKEGHIVGRIKGGDPYVFGRGGEEALRLYEEGIDFEVIPGITSALAVLNYAGIPATHRGLAQSFHVFTGKSVDQLELSWQAAAALKGTLIFLMGLENIVQITEGLKAAGKDGNCPAAVIMRGTTAKQQKVEGTLEDICQKVKAAGFTSPCMIVIGEVAALSGRLSWYEKKPLFGSNICITRSKEQAAGLRDRLLDMGAEVTEINTIDIRSVPGALTPYLDKLGGYQYILFTSVNAVNIFFDHLKEAGRDIREITGSFAVIGPATEGALRARGLFPAVTAEKFIAESLVEALQGKAREGDKILLPHSKEARPVVAQSLKAWGCNVDEVYIYEIHPGQPIEQKDFQQSDGVIFTSPTTVRNLIAMAGLENIRSKQLVAIGPITARELAHHGLEAAVCDQYNMDGIVQKLMELKGNKDV
jgi:uroporphyrinogen III methyltransferase/synthase